MLLYDSGQVKRQIAAERSRHDVTVERETGSVAVPGAEPWVGPGEGRPPSSRHSLRSPARISSRFRRYWSGVSPVVDPLRWVEEVFLEEQLVHGALIVGAGSATR